mmetsp:Transcript_17691/g.44535  ORF Transcript_17691/g.44535 Transcript_17691/m.44535 type:complete len:258 (-) Transcript_17691:567-1340(-)
MQSTLRNTHLGLRAPLPTKRVACVKVFAQQEQQPATPAPAAPKMPPRAPPRGMPQRPAGPPVILGPDGKPLEVVPVEKAGSEAWAGVAQLDKGEDDMPYDWTRTAIMVGGDAAALLLFAALGRANHGEGVTPDTLGTALPFLLGWFATAPLLGGYSKQAQGADMGAAAAAAAKVWVVATPLALAIRGLSKGYVPPTPFIIVSMVATCVLLVGWRTAFSKTAPEAPKLSAAQVAASRKNKKGNPFEFLSLLQSLTTRW